MDSFITKIIKNGGKLYPLIIDSCHTNGTGLTNPSIFIDNNNILVNLRHVEYTLFHSEKKKYCHPWGPIQYLHRENDLHLRTNNYLCYLNNNYNIDGYSKVDTSLLDKPPLWDFVGLEDARIVRWNDKLYLTGVRRDTTTNGQGRMELSEIIIEDNLFKEISRFRIPAPDPDNSYCEKNWMPIIDMPFHYVKWCNPLEIVKVDPKNSSCETVFLGQKFNHSHDFRGGSQIITYKDNYMALLHIVDLYQSETGRKDAKYQHIFMIWDKNWNLIKFSKPFNFLGGEVEFSCGMAYTNNKFLITTGFQDNSSFLIECPEEIIENFIDE